MDNLSLVKHYALTYQAKSTDPVILASVSVEPSSTQHGIAWYAVGHNASHSFYLGVNAEGKLMRRSYAVETSVAEENREEYHRLYNSENEEDWQKAWDLEKTVEEDHFYEVSQENIGYIGHW